jgi:hypothetical protein
VFSVVRRGLENRPVKLNHAIECFSMFADVDPGICQISVRREHPEPASCTCDEPGGKRRCRTSCHDGAFLQPDVIDRGK